ncbi:hypothetical protein FBEOM_11272 [Fusarium beomiforme]|uniref:Trichodiene oxygenase cytochrome P450 n=1 Tax=Fusarium beomiforme TaxID=44412 RepID=A0A9P5A9Y4_9HYPO|nr:hypothetical protein FBEOM_11272 [Fusarium beomiforme]
MPSSKSLCWLLLPSLSLGAIDRKHIVAQNTIIRTELITKETTPLQVGNGNFAFNVDTTGMQTYLPFNTMSRWAWHNDTEPDGEPIDAYSGVPRDTHGRNVYYDLPDPDLPHVSQWLIGNPNRINLGRIGLRYNGDTLASSSIFNTHQELDLWQGIITSSFNVDGKKVKVVTQGDFESDAVVFDIQSQLIEAGKLSIEFDFPYPPIHTTKYKDEVFVGVYDFPTNHTTQLSAASEQSAAHIYHDMGTKYYVNIRWPEKDRLALRRLEPHASTKRTAHRYILSSRHGKAISFTAHFSPEKRVPGLPSTIARRNKAGWKDYWNEGGFVDMTGSTNSNATELQRRIVASQYHVRVNSAADGESPQESGLMNNGWYGKFHMEMVVWHSTHWISWGRDKCFHKIFPALYEKLLPTWCARAKKMGWKRARWPKMTETTTGRSSPGGINAYLMWQQPHPMYLAILAFKSQPTKKTLRRWDPILEATADYMASYAWLNESSGKYDLGPPAIGVTQNTPPEITLNLAYEVAYWRYGLDIACEWKKKLGLPVPKHWTTVAKGLAKPPQIDSLYTVYNDKIWDVWTDQNIRGWGRPVLAINSARIGNPKRAIYHLTAYDYWKFDDAGFAIRGGDGNTPPPFMPRNAGFLLASPRICAASRLYEFYWDSYQHGRFWAKLPEVHRQYGPIVRIGPNELHIQDSQYFDTIFGFRPLNKEAMTAKEFGISHALFGVEDYKAYVKKRAAFGSAFSRTKLSKIQDQIIEEIQRGCTWIEDKSKNRAPVDLAFLFRAVPAEIITKYLFGQEYGFLQDVQTTKNLYDKRMDRIFGFSHLGRFIPKEIPLFVSLFRQLILRALGYNDPGSAFLDYFLLAQKLVQKVVARHNDPSHTCEGITQHTVFDDFLDSPLPKEEKEKGPLTQQAIAIWSGGWDTVGFVLTMAAYQLLQNRDAEQRLYQELKDAWKDPAEPPDISALEELPYLNAILKETFRLSPGALCRLSRVNPNRAEQYGNWKIPPGTIISMSIPDVLSDESIWGPDAAIFRPERWLHDGAELDRYLVTFSKGTRVCPGIELAWIETRLVVASLFRRYEMTIAPEAGISDDDIMPYYEGFTPVVKNWISRLPVEVKSRD